jgi:hypothetical protein
VFLGIGIVQSLPSSVSCEGRQGPCRTRHSSQA